jgi:hypothetical protein
MESNYQDTRVRTTIIREYMLTLVLAVTPSVTFEMAKEPSRKAYGCYENDEGVPCQRAFGSKSTLLHHLAEAHFGTECFWPGCGDPHHASTQEVVECLYRHNEEATPDPAIMAWPSMPTRQFKHKSHARRALKMEQKKIYKKNNAKKAVTGSAIASAVLDNAANPTDSDVESGIDTRPSQPGGLYDIASLPVTHLLPESGSPPATVSLAGIASPPVADSSFGLGSGGHHGVDGTFVGGAPVVGARPTVYLSTTLSHNGDQIHHDSLDYNAGNGYQNQLYPSYITQGFDEEGYDYEGHNVRGCLDLELVDPRIRDL